VSVPRFRPSLALICLIALLALPTAAQPAQVVTVFAAASLTSAFEQIALDFEAAYPGVDVVFSFAGSSALATQISEGAPADVFASADMRQMQAAADSGRITAAPVIFAHNRLAIITPADNPAGISTFRDLAAPGLRLVLAAPGVPVRVYTDEMLARASAMRQIGPAFSEAVLANVVSEEDNVRQVAVKVQLGEADAGVVYTSDAALEPALLRLIAIPRMINPRASYPIAPLADSAQPELAAAFIAAVLSAQGQAVLAGFGFEPAQAG
jgi:molybdate transport system substrate-binding protein